MQLCKAWFKFLNLENTTFCVLRFLSHCFTASDGSEESTAGRVVSRCSIMVHHGFRSKEARRAEKQKCRLRQTTIHSSLLAVSQGDVSGKLNHAFLLVDSFNFSFVEDERSDIFTASAPLRKDTGVFESFARFIGLKCYYSALYLCFIIYIYLLCGNFDITCDPLPPDDCKLSALL